jgi:release factor glutamine methyltransferase
MTLREGLEHGEAHLRGGPHPERARRDAEALLLHVVRRERAALLARWKEVLAKEEAVLYAALIVRRAAGEPLQYILGETEFYGLTFKVTPDVLIPRPETEHLVEKVIELAAGYTQPCIVDMGTGSGAISVALARALPDAQITAIDVSPSALAIAGENARRNAASERIRFLQGRLLAPVAAELFDIVVSNPPYVPASERASLDVEVRDYEPGLALFAGEDGLDVIRHLIPDAFATLAHGGRLALEFGFGQVQAVSTLLRESGFEDIEIVPDLQGIPRVAFGRRP